VNVIHGKGCVVEDEGWEGVLYRDHGPSSKEIELTAIPYYAWDNRSAGEMRIWLRARTDQ
jgi:DUF1680 family protein